MYASKVFFERLCFPKFPLHDWQIKRFLAVGRLPLPLHSPKAHYRLTAVRLCPERPFFNGDLLQWHPKVPSTGLLPVVGSKREEEESRGSNEEFVYSSSSAGSDGTSSFAVASLIRSDSCKCARRAPSSFTLGKFVGVVRGGRRRGPLGFLREREKGHSRARSKTSSLLLPLLVLIVPTASPWSL